MIADFRSLKGASLTKITVIGSGYVGLVQGVCLANSSHAVVIHDIDLEKINSLKELKSPIYEPKLDKMLEESTQAGRLVFTTKLDVAINGCEICFICVATPPNQDGSSNLTTLFSVVEMIAKKANNNLFIVIKSTVPPGTAKKVTDHIAKQNPVVKIEVLSNPEFLQEGSAIENCMNPDRVIIGSSNPNAAKTLGKIYTSLSISEKKIIYMDQESAEMTKYAANTMLASRISMINEISCLCEKFGADIVDVKKGISLDPRIGEKYLNPGIGFGGSCLPKDLSALIASAKTHNLDVPMLQAISITNNSLVTHFVNKITTFYQTNSLSSLTIAIWGLSFKKGTDDVRNSPALEVIKLLLSKGAKLRLFDPLAMTNAKLSLKENKDFYWAKDCLNATENADALCCLTEHPEFQLVDFDQVKAKMKSPIVFDGRNFLPKEKLIMLKFTYFGIGT